MARLTNAEKQRAYREKKKQQSLLSLGGNTPGAVASVAGEMAAPGEVGEDGLRVEVKVDETPVPKQSLKDRMLAKLQGDAPPSPTPPTKRASGRGKKSQDNLLSTVAPTVIASFVATYSRQLIADPYKPCAPSQEEVTGMIGPLMEILARQVEITGKASQTTIDLINSIICTMMYGIRAYITYVDIKQKDDPAYEEARQQRDHRRVKREQEREQEARDYDAGLRTYQNSLNGLGSNHHGSNASANEAYASSTTSDVSSGSAIVDDGTTEGRDAEVAAISQLLSRDRAGRVRLGLLPV